MKYVLIIIAAVFFTNEVTRIAEINKRKRTAKEAYQAGNYDVAIEQYRFLIDSLQVNEDEVLLNLSNSYFHIQDSTNARKNYSMLTSSDNREVRSRAHQQLGVMDFAEQNLETALQNFKQALKAEPNNEEARYNYELLKKILEEQKEQEQEQEQNQQDENQENQENEENQENQDQQNQDQQQGEPDKEQQDQQQQDQKQEGEEQEQEQQEEQEQEGEQQEEEKEGEQKEDPMFDPEQLEELNISEEKARMILEAMKNNEVQYIQQNKRKAQQPRKSGKPDW